MIQRHPARVTPGGIQVTELGEGDRRVVFVHGILDRGRAFLRVAEHLDGECTMLWYDRRGYGRSRDLPGVPAPVAVQISDLIEVLDGRPAVLVGHSFGGVPTLGAAARAPELVEAVVLYETSIAWSPGWNDDGMAAVYAAADPEAAALQLMLGPAAIERMDDDEWAWRRAEAGAFLAEERSVREATPFDVARVAAPVVYGHGDQIVMPMVIEFLAESVGHFEVVRIPGAAHPAHRSHPADVAGLVRMALARSG